MNYSDAKPPSLFWTLTEGRAVFELSSFLTLRWATRYLEKGDGHPVLVLPGFLASDASTKPLRGVLKDLGYAPYPWELGRNLFFNEEREAKMQAVVRDIYRQHKEPVSIIGWSLGGVFARELAKALPEKVRSVISLGSPIHGNRRYSNARTVYDQLNGSPDENQPSRMAQLHRAPPVPTTSIYSKTDGIVAWQGSIQPNDKDNLDTENIEVPASHFGLGVNPLVMYIIADRLAQPSGEWAPFDRSGIRSVFYPTPEAS
ncbi:MAG: alpha/beta hydrolase [Pseudomonadota bacterium]